MRQVNPFHTNIMIDSCAFDPKYSPESEASEELLGNNDLSIIVTHSNLKEIEHPNTPKRVKDLARSRVYTIQQTLTAKEIQTKSAIHQILTGNGKPEKMAQDAEHVFESQKYGGLFVTTDSRILSKRNELQKVSNAHILKPSELLAAVQNESA